MRDDFFADAPQPKSDCATAAQATAPAGGDVDDLWFEQASLDTLTGEDAGPAPSDAIGAAALSLDRELVRRPARRCRPAAGVEPTAEHRRRRRAPSGRGSRMLAVGALAVVLVITVALIANPPLHSSAPPTPADVAGEPAPAPRAPRAASARRPVRRAAVRHRDLPRRAHRQPPAPPRDRTQHLRARVVRQPVAAPAAPTPRRTLAVRPPAPLARPRSAQRAAAPTVFPGDLPTASSTP